MFIDDYCTVCTQWTYDTWTSNMLGCIYLSFIKFDPLAKDAGLK